MKANVLNRFIIKQRSLWILLLIMVFSFLLANNLFAKTAKEIDASVDVAIERFYKQVKGAKEFVKASKGMLAMPNVVKGAFIVGGEYGEGRFASAENRLIIIIPFQALSVFRSEDKKKILSFCL